MKAKTNFTQKCRIMLATVMSMCAIPAAAYDFEVDGCYYNITNTTATGTKTCEITCRSSSSGGYSGDVVIPSTVTYDETTYTVTGIGDRAFYNGSSITSLSIPNTVTYIGDYAFFYSLYLASITIPADVTSIGSFAFGNCISLSSIEIPDAVTYLGDYAFNTCSSLKTATFGEGLERISTGLCGDLTNLTSVTIGSNVKVIADGAFSGCTGLASITIPSSVDSIGVGAFRNTGLTSVTLNEGLESIGGYAFYNTGLKSITIPESVTNIGEDAFSSCSSMGNLVIPNRVETLGGYALSGCSGMSTVTIGCSVGEICGGNFLTNTTLKSIKCANPVPPTVDAYEFQLMNVTFQTGCVLYVPTGSKSLYAAATGWSTFTTIEEDESLVVKFAVDGINYIITDSDAKECMVTFESTSFNSYSGSVTIPKTVTYDGNTYSVTSIGPHAFKDCTGLTSVTIPSSITSIETGAFSGCTSLASVTIPSSVTSLGMHAFSGSGLETITISAQLTEIDAFTFSDCANLTSVTLPTTVTEIGRYAFSGCTSLSSLSIPAATTAIGEYALSNCTSLSIDVDSSNTVYASQDGALYSKDMTTLILCPSTLTSLSVPETVETIGDYACYYCTGLTNLDLPTSVGRIGKYAFSNCSALTEISSLNPTPPICSDEAFTNVDKDECTVTVVSECVDVYSAAEVWEDFYITAPSYTISNLEELYNISSDIYANYRLTADIDLSGVEYEPIADFSGTLDGRGHIIRNLTIDDEETENVGLFTQCNEATIKNLGIENANIVGSSYVGAIAGTFYGGSIEQCYIGSSYIEGYEYVGSFVGAMLPTDEDVKLTISNSVSNAKVEARSGYAGGMVGLSRGGTVSECLFCGTIDAPGIVTGIVGVVTNGDIYTNRTYAKNNMLAAAHLFGSQTVSRRMLYHSAGYTVGTSNNYAISSTLAGASSTQYVATYTDWGNEAYDPDAASGSAVDDALAKTQEFYTDTLGWDFDSVWKFFDGTEGSVYPVLQWMTAPLPTEFFDLPYDETLEYADADENSVELDASMVHGSWGQTATITIVEGEDLVTYDEEEGMIYVGNANGEFVSEGYVVVQADMADELTEFYTLYDYQASIYVKRGIVAGDEYLVVNEETGFYLGGGLDWGTHATLLEKPQRFVITTFNYDALKFYFNSQQYNSNKQHFFSYGGYTDETSTVWKITEVDTNVYTMYHDSVGYVKQNGLQEAITFTSDVDEAATWRLVHIDDFVASLSDATDDNPIDATAYIKFPELKRFCASNYYTSWTATGYGVTTEAKNYSFGDSEGSTANCAQSYHSANGFDISQTLSDLKPGKYTLTAEGFYRNDYAYIDGDNTTAPSVPVLYVDDETANLNELESENWETNNTMATAYASFLDKQYTVGPIEFTVSADQEVTIGFSCSDTNLWCVFGELTLLYYGGDGSEGNAIDSVIVNPDSDVVVVGIYNLLGQKLAAPQRGINIIYYSDGTGKKVLVK